MEAGRELDAEIAEKVTGWKPCGLLGKDHKYAVKEFYEPPHYSTDIAAAHEVISALKNRLGDEFFEFRMQTGGEEWEARVWLSSGPIESFRAPTAPEAICRVALQALPSSSLNLEKGEKE